MIGQQIHDKLVTDFAALQFEGGNTLFANVKKFFAASTMESRDCVILPDFIPETVEGDSAGNSQTTREYAFRAVFVEQIEATDSDSEGSIKYSRIMNTADAVLAYLQKEPNNLRTWSSTNLPNSPIYKIRVRNPRFETLQSSSGYVVAAEISFGVFLNVIPQNL